MNISENFRLALEDYMFLLNKKYPEKSIRELVSARYSLDHFERSMLYRGISTDEKAGKRKARLATIEQLSNRTLHIDLFNVLYTLAAYLRGYPVYFSNDGLVRDASESHGTGEWQVHLDKGLDLLLKYLETMEIKKAVIYIDHPVENSYEITERLRDAVQNSKHEIEMIADPSPDHHIKSATDGIIVTSDSTIIDKSILPVFDMPRFILTHSFHRDINSLENINKEYINP